MNRRSVNRDDRWVPETVSRVLYLMGMQMECEMYLIHVYVLQSNQIAEDCDPVPYAGRCVKWLFPHIFANRVCTYAL